MSDPILEWQNVSYSVRHGFWLSKKKIIKDFSLQLKKGSVTGLIGANGAGKTTSIKLGAGLIEPEAGQVLINGVSASDADARSRIGLLTENQYIYPTLKLNEWLRMLGRISGLKDSGLKKRIEYVLEMVDLGDRADHLMRHFSKGQLQRAGIAQTFLHEPEIVLLDEPMSGLDPFWRSRIHTVLSDFSKAGGTVLFSSHIISDVLKLSDKIAVIKSGSIQWSGTMGQLPGTDTELKVVCYPLSIDDLNQYIQIKEMDIQQDGSISMTIESKNKTIIYRLAAEGKIAVESINPIYPGIEEIFYDDQVH